MGAGGGGAAHAFDRRADGGRLCGMRLLGSAPGGYAELRFKGPVSYTHLDVYKRQGPVADQGGPLYRLAHHAIAHAVSLGAGEHEFAIGDILSLIHI